MGGEVEVDPRVMRTRRVVLEAVIAELAESGHAGFTIEGVAARCGVGKSTVYRHWASRSALIADALRTLNPQPQAGESAPPRDRVRKLLEHLTTAVTQGPLASAIPALIEAAERDPAIRELFHDYSAGRRRALRDAIAAGVDAGDFGSNVDPELAAHALSGAIFYARLMTASPLGRHDVETLISTALGPGPD